MFRLKWSVPFLAVLVAGCGGGRSGPAPATELPLTFAENRGQSDARVAFQVQGPGHAFYLTPSEIALAFERPTGEGVALHLRFENANPAVRPSGRRRAPGVVSYLQPNAGQTGVPAYEEVTYPELWRNTELALRGNGATLKYEFRLKPGADPSAIRLD